MNKRPVIVLTGGPGGGKSSLIEDLRRDPAWAQRFVALPETVHYAKFVNIPYTEKLFQRAMVYLQIGLEDALNRALDANDPRAIICHRGTLDPLAFWQQRGWSVDEFFKFTNTTRAQHYHRYAAVIHLVTAADGAPNAYARFPASHRPEEADEAIRLDHWLREAWCEHPHYFRIDNAKHDWATKSQEARRILAEII
jgi:predicted ATPase